MPEAKPGKPPAPMGRIGFLQRLAMAAGALGLGVLAWPRLSGTGAGPADAAPRPARTPTRPPPTHSVKRRG